MTWRDDLAVQAAWRDVLMCVVSGVGNVDMEVGVAPMSDLHYHERQVLAQVALSHPTGCECETVCQRLREDAMQTDIDLDVAMQKAREEVECYIDAAEMAESDVVRGGRRLDQLIALAKAMASYEAIDERIAYGPEAKELTYGYMLEALEELRAEVQRIAREVMG